MNQIVAYLTFNGNCREAMEFYQWCLGGELQLHTLGDTPMGGRFPRGYRSYVVTASLAKDNMRLLATDMLDRSLVRGNSMSILLEVSDREIMEGYYNRLKEGSLETQPLDRTHWGDLFGGLVDKYGTQWLFQCKNMSNDKN
jgi:PhnB protein